MKSYLYILMAFILITGCNTKQSGNQVVIDNEPTTPLKIKVCKMYSSDFVLLDPEEKGQLIQEFRFNKKGFVNELIRYGIDEEITGRFDILGENTPFPMPGKPAFVDTVLTVVDIDSLGVINGKEVKIYNREGKLIEVKYYESNGELEKKNTYTYDNQGMIKEDVYWDVDLDKPKQKIRYEFEYFTD